MACLKEVAAFCGGGDGAGGEAAEEAVAQAGDLAIAEFTKRARNEAEKRGGHGPGLGQGAQAGEDGVGADEHVFEGCADVAKHDDRVGCGLGWSDAMLGEELDGLARLPAATLRETLSMFFSIRSCTGFLKVRTVPRNSTRSGITL